MTSAQGPAPRRLRIVLIVGAAIAVLVIAGVAIVFAGLPRVDAAGPSQSPRPTQDATSPDPAAVAELEERLESGEVEQLTLALDLAPAEIDAALLDGFAAADIEFDLAGAEPVDGGWYIPTTITDSDGQVSTWSSAIAESENGLILVDTMEAGQ